MRMVMYRARLVVEEHCSRVRDVCPVRLAADGYILERLAVEGQLELGLLAQLVSNWISRQLRC